MRVRHFCPLACVLLGLLVSSSGLQIQSREEGNLAAELQADGCQEAPDDAENSIGEGYTADRSVSTAEQNTETLRKETSETDSSPTTPLPKKPRPKRKRHGCHSKLTVVHNLNLMHHEGPLDLHDHAPAPARPAPSSPAPAKPEPRTECQWSEWSKCSKSCGGGTQTRTMVTSDGKTCPTPKKESRACNEEACPRPHDCQWQEWNKWGPCSQTCGGGSQTRTRSKKEAENDGHPCKGSSEETQKCGQQECPRDCEWGQWAPWGECSKTCGGGSQTRSRQKRVVEKSGGKCPGKPSQDRICATDACPQKVDCKWSSWSPWSKCSARCKGLQTRTRKRAREAANGGEECSGDPIEKRKCGLPTCERECVIETGERRFGGSYKAGSTAEHLNVDEHITYGAKACWEDCYKACLEHEDCKQVVWYGGAGGHCFPMTQSYNGKEADSQFNSAVCFGHGKGK